MGISCAGTLARADGLLPLSSPGDGDENQPLHFSTKWLLRPIVDGIVSLGEGFVRIIVHW